MGIEKCVLKQKSTLIGGGRVKILNIEDDIFKHNDIRKALEFCGVHDVDWCENLQDGIEMLDSLINEDKNTYDLIISDMHYPLAKGMVADYDAGKKLIAYLKDRNVNIPVIICSSLRLKIPEAKACVWYNPSRDLGWDFKEIIQQNLI